MESPLTSRLITQTVIELATLRAENKRLALADRQWADHVKRLAEENERLKAEVTDLRQKIEIERRSQ